MFAPLLSLVDANSELDLVSFSFCILIGSANLFFDNLFCYSIKIHTQFISKFAILYDLFIELRYSNKLYS